MRDCVKLALLVWVSVKLRLGLQIVPLLGRGDYLVRTDLVRAIFGRVFRPG